MADCRIHKYILRPAPSCRFCKSSIKQDTVHTVAGLHVDGIDQPKFIICRNVVGSLVDHIHQDGGQVDNHEDTEKVSREDHSDLHDSLVGVRVDIGLHFPLVDDILTKLPLAFVYQFYRIELGEAVVST